MLTTSYTTQNHTLTLGRFRSLHMVKIQKFLHSRNNIDIQQQIISAFTIHSAAIKAHTSLGHPKTHTYR